MAAHILHIRVGGGAHRGLVLVQQARALLRRLYETRNRVLTRTDVLRELWGDDSFFNGRRLDVFITRRRRYLRHDPQVQVVNVRGVRYKLLS